MSCKAASPSSALPLPPGPFKSFYSPSAGGLSRAPFSQEIYMKVFIKPEDGDILPDNDGIEGWEGLS